MKTAIVIGVFVLVACLHLQANGAVYRGFSKDCSIPKSFESVCHTSQCNDIKTGEYQVSTCGVSAISCPEGQVADPGQEDLTKDYPNCCAKPSCRDE